MGTVEPRSDIVVTDAAARSFASVRTLVVPTQTDDSDCLQAARAAVATHPAPENVTVVLYDRSNETWADTPHPSGPYGLDELPDGHDDLAAQMNETTTVGVTVRAWLSTLPSLTDIVSAVQELDADAVLLPDPVCDQRLFDRLTGRRDVNADVAATIDHNLASPVTVFALDGSTVDLMTVTEVGTSAR